MFCREADLKGQGERGKVCPLPPPKLTDHITYFSTVDVGEGEGSERGQDVHLLMSFHSRV